MSSGKSEVHAAAAAHGSAAHVSAVAGSGCSSPWRPRSPPAARPEGQTPALHLQPGPRSGTRRGATRGPSRRLSRVAGPTCALLRVQTELPTRVPVRSLSFRVLTGEAEASGRNQPRRDAQRLRQRRASSGSCLPPPAAARPGRCSRFYCALLPKYYSPSQPALHSQRQC